MGYYVRPLPKKMSDPQWTLLYVSCKKKDRRKESKNKLNRTVWAIPKKRWYSLGFYETMSLEDAKVRTKQLNAREQLKLQEEQIKKFQDKQSKFQLRHDAILPEAFVSEFEECFIKARGNLSPQEYQSRSKQRYTAWRAAQKAIVAVNKEPEQWFFCFHEFYDYFYQRKFSISYSIRILQMINKWGTFVSRKLQKPFLRIAIPRGYERKRILEAYYSKPDHKRGSEPITPEQLNDLKSDLIPENFNWLYLSVWLGLRPGEIDQLKNPDLWKSEILPTGRKVLWIYQTKIVSVHPDERWKPIPVLFDEQHFALEIVHGQNFKRPIPKTMKKYFGRGYSLYGGRKGFFDLMLSRKCDSTDISIWMGHSTIHRTWRNYKNKRIYHV